MKLVECNHCHAVNRLPGYSLARVPLCGKCEQALKEPGYIKICRAIFKAKYWIFLVAIIASVYLFTSFGTNPSSKSPTTDLYSNPGYKPESIVKSTVLAEDKKQETPFNQPAVVMRQGLDKVYVSKDSLVASLEIITPSGPEKYYFKLVDVNSNKPVLTFFVRGGQRFETEVPLGRFLLKYATGRIWYGDVYSFGPETSYNKEDEIFEFSRQGNQATRYTVNLVAKKNAGFPTTRILASEF